ncbi:MAG: polysaccharide biosynthesis tyrosine autokinase [Planctomycetes bacterium]|nr:polysaccharide biosynthesis tyrosine autokinase [Planctomycetota bacterium]
MYVLRKRIGVILPLVILGMVLGVFFVANTEPMYGAKAQLLFSVGPPSSRGEVVNKDYAGVGLSTIWEQDAYIATQIELLKGRGLAEEVVRRLRLQDNEEFWGARGGVIHRVRAFVSGLIGKSAETTRQPADINTAIGLFLSRIDATRVKQGRTSDSRIVTVTFEGSDKETVKNILSTTLDVFKEQDRKRRFKAVSEVLSWLGEKQGDVQLAVKKAEDKVQEYIEKENLAVIPQQFQGEVYSVDQEKLVKLNTAIVEASTQRIQAETLYRSLEELAKKDQAFPNEQENIVVQELKSRYAGLEVKRSTLGKRFGEKWPEVQDIDNEMTAIKRQIREERRKSLDAARAAYELAKQREGQLKQALTQQKAATIELRRKSVTYRMLRGEAKANEQLFDMLVENAKEANIAQSIDRSQIDVVTPAYIAGEKAVARAKKKALGIVFLFIAGAYVLALSLEMLNPTLQVEEEVENQLGVRILGSVTAIDRDTLDGNGKYFSVLPRDHPRSIYVEQFRRIATNTLAHALSKERKVLLITSVLPQEGKSFVAANLAACLASMGKRTLLIDADMHQPKQNEVFDCEENVVSAVPLHECRVGAERPRRMGFAGLLQNGAVRDDSIIRTNVRNLSLLVAGERDARRQATPFPLGRARSIFAELKKNFDAVLLDCAPVGVVADALALSQVADGVLLVLKSGNLRTSAGRHLLRQMENAKANVVGLILNAVPPRLRGFRYYYEYNYYYPNRFYGYYGGDEDGQSGEGGKIKTKTKARKKRTGSGVDGNRSAP